MLLLYHKKIQKSSSLIKKDNITVSEKQRHRKDNQLKAFDDHNIDMKFYTTRKRELDEVFPWDFIDIGVTKNYLKREWLRAKEGKITENCMIKCNGCGANVYGAGKFCFK